MVFVFDVVIYALFTAGNHDCYYENEKKDVIKVTNKSNIIYLNKDTYEFNGVRFVGIDYDEDLEKSLTELKDNGKLEDDIPNILLLHAPKSPKKLKKYNIFLALSGHTHNGQLFHQFLYINTFVPANFLITSTCPYP